MPIQMLELLPAELRPEDVEDIAERLTRSDADGVALDLRRVKRSFPFADGRLLSLCALAGRRGVAIDLKVASGTTPGTLGQRYDKLFGASTLGLILGHFARSITDDSGADLTEQVRETRSKALNKAHHGLPLGVVGAGADVAIPAIDRYGEPSPAELLHEEAVTMFPDRFRRLVIRTFNLPFREDESIGGRPLMVGRPESSSLDRISQFADETFQNTTEHGSRDYNWQRIDGMRLVILRRTILERRSIGSFESDPSSPLTAYFQALTEDGYDLYDKSLIEITVGDCGVGIPGRLSKSRDIYSGPLEVEQEVVQSALREDITSKPKVDPGAGIGLDKAVKAVWALKGMVLFRTGRTCLFSHYGLQPDKPPFRLKPAGERAYSFVPGTLASVLFLYQNNTDRPSVHRG